MLVPEYWRQDPGVIAKNRLPCWRTAVEKGKFVHQVWSPDLTDETKRRFKVIYRWVASQVNERAVRLQAERLWGEKVRTLLKSRGIQAEIPTDSDHRELIEWLRVEHPTITAPDFLQQYFLLLVEEYIKNVDR